MLTFNSTVNVGNFQFKGVNEINITSSLYDLCDKATIKLPGLEEQIGKDIQIGDRVEIYLGYNGEENLEFSGYVDQVSPDIPLTVTCEDEMWWLKRVPITKDIADLINKASCKVEVLANTEGENSNLLSSFLKPIQSLNVIPGVNLFIPDLDIGNFRAEVGSLAKLLQKIKDTYSLAIYFRQKNLYVGFPYTLETFETPIIYDLQRNVVSSDITDKTLDEIKLRLDLVSLPNTGKEEPKIVSKGDPSDVLVTVHVSNVKNPTSLDLLATEMLAKLKYNRYFSSITTFGIPFIQHSQKVKIIDDNYKERRGTTGRREETYFVSDVQTNVSKNGGFRRQVTLDRKVNPLNGLAINF